MFHKSVYGQFGNGFKADDFGFVAESVKDALECRYRGQKPSRKYAGEIARKNLEALESADVALADFREG